MIYREWIYDTRNVDVRTSNVSIFVFLLWHLYVLICHSIVSFFEYDRYKTFVKMIISL